MTDINKLFNRFQIKYAQNGMVGLKPSVIRVFKSVKESIVYLTNSIKDPKTQTHLNIASSKLDEYLSKNQLNLLEYKNFVKDLVQNLNGNIDPEYKVKHITKPLEFAYKWMAS